MLSEKIGSAKGTEIEGSFQTMEKVNSLKLAQIIVTLIILKLKNIFNSKFYRKPMLFIN